MSLQVLTALTGAPWEAELVTTLERAPSAVHIVRRCVDLPDLLATAATGQAQAALLSADLRRLDRDAIARLGAGHVALVGLVTPGDEQAERRLRQLGVQHVIPADSAADVVASAVAAALAQPGVLAVDALDGIGLDGLDGLDGIGVVEHLDGTRVDSRLIHRGYADPAAALPVTGWMDEPAPDLRPGAGRLVAVWGPTGAPGRTTVAVNLAHEAAAADTQVLLADADVYGGVVAQVLGLLDESPGLAAAARLANNGSLDLPGLASLAAVVSPRLRVLTGIARADRWPELRPAAVETVWALARSLADLTVVDCGFGLEQDEEISFDTLAPRRNGVTLVTLEAADVVIAVCRADAVGVQRFVHALPALREVVAAGRLQVVLSQVRASAVGADPEGQLRAALDRYAGVTPIAALPYDRSACDAALLHGRCLADVAGSSALRTAIANLAARLVGPPAATGRRGRRRRRTQRG